MASGGFGTSDDILRWLARAGRELGRDEEAALRRVARLAYWLDDRFRIPGTGRRVGLDGLLGLIPGIGDTATTLVAAYIVIEAARLGVAKRTIARMLGNVGVDYVIGLVPLVGDLADLAWKANRRNARLLHEHLTAERSGAAPPQGPRIQSMVEPGPPAGHESAEGRGGDDGQRPHRRRAMRLQGRSPPDHRERCRPGGIRRSPAGRGGAKSTGPGRSTRAPLTLALVSASRGLEESLTSLALYAPLHIREPETGDMAIRVLHPLAVSAAIVSLAACASIVSDSEGVVTISSNPTAAEIAVADQSGAEIYRGTTPTTLTLDASAGYFDGQEYTITFSKDGYDPTTVKVDSRINGWYVGNIVFGGFVGWLIVDPLTGAMWTLDTEQVNGVLGERVAMDETSAPQLRIVSVDAVPASERSRMVRVHQEGHQPRR